MKEINKCRAWINERGNSRFKNSKIQRTEVGGRKSEIRNQKSEVGGKKSKVRGMKKVNLCYSSESRSSLTRQTVNSHSLIIFLLNL